MKIIPLEFIPLGHCFFIFISIRRRFFFYFNFEVRTNLNFSYCLIKERWFLRHNVQIKITFSHAGKCFSLMSNIQLKSLIIVTSHWFSIQSMSKFVDIYIRHKTLGLQWRFLNWYSIDTMDVNLWFLYIIILLVFKKCTCISFWKVSFDSNTMY